MKRRSIFCLLPALLLCLAVSPAAAEVRVGGKTVSPAAHRSMDGPTRDIFYRPYAGVQPVSQSPEDRQGYIAYQVLPGDTLGQIAQDHLGNANLAYSLASLNGITNPDQIQAGQTLYIPKPRVGLQYKIEWMKPTGQGCALAEVTDNHVFQSGDKFRFRVKPNTNGYLYIFNRGTSGRQYLVFPDPRVQKGNNYIHAYREYTVPAVGWFQFDETPGRESLFLVQSLKPVQSFANLTAPAAQNPGQFFAQPLNPQQWQVVSSRMQTAAAQNRDIFLAYDQPTGGGGAAPASHPQSGYISQPLASPDDSAVVEIVLTHR